jgi:hypothetical protein
MSSNARYWTLHWMRVVLWPLPILALFRVGRGAYDSLSKKNLNVSPRESGAATRKRKASRLWRPANYPSAPTSLIVAVTTIPTRYFCF